MNYAIKRFRFHSHRLRYRVPGPSTRLQVYKYLFALAFEFSSWNAATFCRFCWMQILFCFVSESITICRELVGILQSQDSHRALQCTAEAMFGQLEWKCKFNCSANVIKSAVNGDVGHKSSAKQWRRIFQLLSLQICVILIYGQL